MLLKNCAVDFVEICNVCTRNATIKAAKRIFNSDKICRSYCDFYFGVTFLEHSVYVTAIDRVNRGAACGHTVTPVHYVFVKFCFVYALNYFCWWVNVRSVYQSGSVMCCSVCAYKRVALSTELH